MRTHFERAFVCGFLTLTISIAVGQDVRDAKSARRAPVPSSAAENPAPAGGDQCSDGVNAPWGNRNVAPAARSAGKPMLTPAAAAPQGVKSASILPAKGEVLPATDLPAPPNDNCADAEVVYLTSGVPAYVSGDNTGATEDCPALSGGAYGESWYLLDLPAQMNVTIKYCGTTPAFCNAYIVMDTTCPCSGSWIFAGNWENTSCGDGNWTLYWYNLPAGQYYWPLLMDATCAYGPYTIEFFGEEPQPCAECPPGGRDECETDWNGNGVPDERETCGDVDSDGDVDRDNYWIFVSAFGTCVGDPQFVVMADMDGDGCVTLADYRAWRMCYKMYNGKDFALPKWKSAPGGGGGEVVR